MPRIWLAVLFVLLAAEGLLHAQNTLPRQFTRGEQNAPPIDLDAAPVVVTFDTLYRPRIWGSAEYLLWKVSSGSLPQVTTTPDPALATFPGAFGQPGTQVIAGGNVDIGNFSGGRVTFGWALNKCVGVEISGFVFQQHTENVTLASNAAGIPYLGFPVFRSQFNREGAFTVSDRTFPQSGSIDMSLNTRLWGVDANVLVAGPRCFGCLGVNWLGGFRFAALHEDVRINTSVSNRTINAGFNSVTTDNFAARNHFYGGQFGVQLDYRRDRFFCELSTILAIGANAQTVDINGLSTQSGPGAVGLGSAVEGVFAQRSNIGNREECQFGIMPQARIKIGYQCCRGVSIFAGYDLLYWTGVVRAGDQIDRRVNSTQSQVGGAGVLSGPADPSPDFRRSDFFAHGLNFGIQVRY